MAPIQTTYGSTSSTNPAKQLTLTPPGRFGRWYLNMFLINFVEFATESARGVVLATLFLYNQSLGGDLAFMGFLTSMSSIGRLISSTVFGWMCDRYIFKFVYIVSSVICFLGNLIYLIAEWNVANSGLYTLAASRFLGSFGAGNRSVCRANVATMTTVSQRLKYITILASVVFLGYALTPGLGSLVANVDTHFLGIHFNMFTAPGLILVVFNLLTILSMVTIYDESIGKQNGPPESPRSCVLSNPLNDPTSLPDRVVSIGALVFIFLNFNARGILSVFETVKIPLFFEATGSDPTSTDSYFNRIMSEVNWVHLGFATLTFGNVLLVIAPRDLTFLRLSIAELFIWSIGSPISTAVVIAGFSKLLGGRPQGTLMGLMSSAASVSRTILPLLPAVFSSMAPLFWINIAVCVTSIFVLVWYKQLIDKSCDVESSDGETDSLTDSSA
ncbi:hypothetical protein Poli38472_013141 [Pythium oligandrum]|uniref:Major facilitator superfamily (MFS) profile domain-containing protein n=1 Tax=Pythium oligandrum TaxID=41045 RepID=A0A8K1C2J3_PYTOL|nr:hypothetical protein Poli38472_013141 [Pythium oligandrum]|eukprot:TMW55250.1 hypothetical protein Poli38472_013141 [Pythium oligandrum]